MKKKINFIFVVPKISEKLVWQADENGNVVITVKHEGFLNRCVQRLFKTPKESKISLDEIGSFVFLATDGKKRIYDIADEMRLKYPQKCDPLYKRISEYYRALKINKFVTFEIKGDVSVNEGSI